MKAKRVPYQVVMDIMEIARTGAIKSYIMQGANLDFNHLNLYLDILTRKKLIYKATDNRYWLTDSGEITYKKLQDASRIIDEVLL